MGRLMLGMQIHDLDNMSLGGTLTNVGRVWCTCRTPDGFFVKLPTARAVKGGPRIEPLPLTPEDIPGLEDVVKACNCAGCGRELLGASNPESVLAMLSGRERLADRMGGRPYCQECLDERLRTSGMFGKR